VYFVLLFIHTGRVWLVGRLQGSCTGSGERADQEADAIFC